MPPDFMCLLYDFTLDQKLPKSLEYVWQESEDISGVSLADLIEVCSNSGNTCYQNNNHHSTGEVCVDIFGYEL